MSKLNKSTHNNLPAIRGKVKPHSEDGIKEIKPIGKGVFRVSLIHNGKLIKGDTKLSLLQRIFTHFFSDKRHELIVVNRKRTQEHIPLIYAIILLSGLIFVNVMCQAKLDQVQNEFSDIKYQLEQYKEQEQIYTEQLRQKDKALLQEYESYITNNMGMVRDDPNVVYVDLPLEDEIIVIEKPIRQNGWTSMLSSMGKFISELFE